MLDHYIQLTLSKIINLATTSIDITYQHHFFHHVTPFSANTHVSLIDNPSAPCPSLLSQTTHKTHNTSNPKTIMVNLNYNMSRVRLLHPPKLHLAS